MTHVTIEQAKLEQALKALVIADNIALVGAAYTPKSIDAGVLKMRNAVSALREAMAEQPAQQEPVAALYDDGTWIAKNTDAGRALTNRPFLFTGSPAIDVYITSPAPVPLTDEQIEHLWETRVSQPCQRYPLEKADWVQFARAIEAAHGITKGRP
jgi:hypothetical protein